MTSSSEAIRPVLAGSPPSAADSVSAITARMDRLPMSRHLWILVLLISLGGFFEIYDLIFTGYIAPGMAKSGMLETTTAAFFGFKGIGAFVAATFAGLFVGTFGLGFLPDRYGRRAVFTFSLLWYSIGSAIMAFQSTSEGVILWRFITGIGVGVEIITIDAYISELVPQNMRGRAMAFNQAVMFGAAPVAALLSYFLVPIAPHGIDGWRWVVLIGAVGAVVVWFIRRSLPESPRWLAQHGHAEEADRAVQLIEKKVTAQYGKPLPPARPSIPAGKPATVSFSAIWKPPYRSRVIMLIAFNFFQAIGYYGFANWVPTLLIGQGITVTKSLLYSFIIAFALPIGPLLAMTVADKIQRKWLIVVPALAVIVFGVLFSQTKATPLLIVFGVLISLAGQIISVSYHAYQAELFPTSVRARASGLVYSASRIGAMLSGFLVAYLLRNFGVVGVFAGIVSCMLIVAISIGGFGPKTKGLALEEISH
ncbi:MAG: putative MFS-type transporter [Burkholderiaceae bacterium]|jgi:putative MFS transporter|nr:MAG: putative MFS-type transporter [Burkholderiaceae bacterium]